MASSAFARRITASPLKIGAPIYHTTRRLSHHYRDIWNGRFSKEYIVAELLRRVSPSVVALKTCFDHSSSFRAATGVFVSPGRLITSAHAVGRVVGAHGEIGCTAAITAAGKVLRMSPLAVNFGGDVALLQAAVEDPNIPPPSSLAVSVPVKQAPVTVISRHEEGDDTGVLQVTPTYFYETSPRRPEWVHPVEDGLGWARYGSVHVDGVKIIPGSPWFNLCHEVVGIASWAAGKEPADSSAGFVVPLRRLLDMFLTGEMTKGIVVDPWIETTKVYGDYNAHPVHNKEWGNVRRRFVSTASSSDNLSFLLSMSYSFEEMVSIDSDGMKRAPRKGV